MEGPQDHGFEFELGWQDQAGEFSYGVNANLATINSEVKKLEGPRILDGIVAFDKGQPMWSYYGWKYLGVDKEDGSAIYYDKDENGTVTGTVDIAYDINFRTVRFETNEQINAFGGENGVMNTLKRENMNMLMIGTVKNDLLGALESAVQNTDGSFKVYNVASGSAYTIFMLAEERFWGFTDVAPISVGNGIEAYTINVMW